MFREPIAWLPELILPQRLHAIRTLHFRWPTNKPPRMPDEYDGKMGPTRDDWLWMKMWSTLAQMEGLRELVMEIHIMAGAEHHAVPLWTEKEVSLLQPAKQVRVRGKFELVLPFPTRTSHTSELEQLPCTIRRLSEVHWLS